MCVCKNNGSITTAIRPRDQTLSGPRHDHSVTLILSQHASRKGKLIRHLQMWIKITVVTRRDTNLMATVPYFTTMNQPQQVGRTDNKRWRPLCIVCLLLCNDVVTRWEHAASNDIYRYCKNWLERRGTKLNYGNLRYFIRATQEKHDKPRSGQPDLRVQPITR